MKFVQVLFIVVIAIMQLKEGSSTPTAGVSADQKKIEGLLDLTIGYLENSDAEVIERERDLLKEEWGMQITIESLRKYKTLISESELFEEFRLRWIRDWLLELGEEIPKHFPKIDVKALEHLLKRDAKPEWKKLMRELASLIGVAKSDVKKWKKLMEKLAFDTLFFRVRYYMIYLTPMLVEVPAYIKDLDNIFKEGKCFEFFEINFKRNGQYEYTSLVLHKPESIMASVDEFKRTYPSKK